MSIPIYLTLSRILLGPLFIAIYLYHEQMGISLRLLPYVLLFLTLISEASDIFDGLLARKKKQSHRTW